MSHRTLLVVVVFLSIFTYDLARPTDIDFWWHLRTGQLIAESGAVPRVDPFSFTAAGRPWVAHEWLWELGVFRLYRLGGYRAAVLLSAIIVTLAYAILYRLLRHLGANEIAAAALVLWAAFLGVPNLGARPREFTFLFFALFLDRLYRYRTGESGQLWLLPLLMPLWANLHGGFVFGLGLLGLFALSETVAWLAGRGPAPRRLWAVTARGHSRHRRAPARPPGAPLSARLLPGRRESLVPERHRVRLPELPRPVLSRLRRRPRRTHAPPRDQGPRERHRRAARRRLRAPGARVGASGRPLRARARPGPRAAGGRPLPVRWSARPRPPAAVRVAAERRAAGCVSPRRRRLRRAPAEHAARQ